jgi:hypothetical protein
MLSSGERRTWSANGIAYGLREDLYSLHERAADYIHEHVLAMQGRVSRAGSS